MRKSNTSLTGTDAYSPPNKHAPMSTLIGFEHTWENGEKDVRSVLIMSLLGCERSPHSLSPLWQAFIRGDTVLAIAVGVVHPDPVQDAAFNSKFTLSKSKPKRNSKK